MMIFPRELALFTKRMSLSRAGWRESRALSFASTMSVASWLSWLERRTGIARSRVQTQLKSWPFQSSIRNCLNCVHNCDDHGLLDFKSAVQYNMKHFIYHFTREKRLLISQALLNLKQQQQQTNKQETWSTNTTPLSRSPGMLIFAVEPLIEPGIFVRYRRNP